MEKKLLGNEDLAVASTLHGLSNIFHHNRNYAAAETPLREALAIEKKQLGDENATVAGTLLDLGWVLELQNKFAEAESVLREGMAIHKKIYGKQSWVSLFVLGSTLLGENKLVEAEAADREAVATFKTGTSTDRFLPELHSKFATILRREGKLGEAETVARKALKWDAKLYNDHNYYYAEYSVVLADVLRDERKLAEAEAVDRQLLAKYSKVRGWQFILPYVYNNLATVLQLQGRLLDAETTARKPSKRKRKLIAIKLRICPDS